MRINEEISGETSTDVANNDIIFKSFCSKAFSSGATFDKRLVFRVKLERKSTITELFERIIIRNFAACD